MSKLSLEERLKVLDTIDALLKKEEAGEDCAKALRRCGKKLGDADDNARDPAKRRYTQYSKESLEQAKRNGIHRQTFWGRITHYQWTEWEAANIPRGMTRKEFYETREIS